MHSSGAVAQTPSTVQPFPSPPLRLPTHHPPIPEPVLISVSLPFFFRTSLEFAESGVQGFSPCPLVNYVHELWPLNTNRRQLSDRQKEQPLNCVWLKSMWLWRQSGLALCLWLGPSSSLQWSLWNSDLLLNCESIPGCLLDRNSGRQGAAVCSACVHYFKASTKVTKWDKMCDSKEPKKDMHPNHLLDTLYEKFDLFTSICICFPLEKPVWLIRLSWALSS